MLNFQFDYNNFNLFAYFEKNNVVNYKACKMYIRKSVFVLRKKI